MDSRKDGELALPEKTLEFIEGIDLRRDICSSTRPGMTRRATSTVGRSPKLQAQFLAGHKGLRQSLDFRRHVEETLGAQEK